MKVSVSTITSLAVLIFTLTAGIVFAQNQSQTGQANQPAPRMMCQDNFNSIDTNHDGKVTKEEFMAVKHPGGRGEEVFKSRDTNGDGVLTKDEFCAGKGMRRGRI